MTIERQNEMMNSERCNVTHTDGPFHQMKHISASFQNFLAEPLYFSLCFNLAKTLEEGPGLQEQEILLMSSLLNRPKEGASVPAYVLSRWGGRYSCGCGQS